MSTKNAVISGTCKFLKTLPPVAPNGDALNVFISFEEALKLNLALGECVRELQREAMQTKDGNPRRVVNLAFAFDDNGIIVLAAKK